MYEQANAILVPSATIDGVEIPTIGTMVTRAEGSSVLEFNYPTERGK